MAGENPVIDLLRRRFARRSISTAPLPEGAVGQLIEAARLTPSCFNNQPWRFLFLESEASLAKGREALTGNNRAWATRAPLLIYGYSRRSDDCATKDDRAYHQFDLGLAVMNIMLAATQLGLVARPMAGFEPTLVKEAFGLADEDEPLVAIAVGLPSDDEAHLPEKYRGLDAKPRIRKAATEIVKRV